jgi:hypothetical protein
MVLLDELITASSSVTSLQHYLDTNFEYIYDFFNNQKHSELVSSRDKLNRYIQLNRNVILALDISEKYSLAFISLLLQISEELGLLASFRFLYEHLKGKNFNVGRRLEAASFYLVGIKTVDDYLDRYNSIYLNLKFATENEEDNTDKVLMTAVNYYAQVIHDFGEFNNEKVIVLREKFKDSCIQDPFSFFKNSLINNVLNVDLSVFSEAYKKIHELLDAYLGRESTKPIFRKDFLIETGTEYCEILGKSPRNFKCIRQISVDKHKLIKSDILFRSLGRGVAILTEEDQLYAYMNSYGNMHYEKLTEAFTVLPEKLFSNKLNLVDWGCGQAMASISLFDYLIQHNQSFEFDNVTLIEPSEVALKRGALHVTSFANQARINTVNKDLDSLGKHDFVSITNNPTIHLFSNILDIDLFSLVDLLECIETNFKGENYFICVSPYINDIRTSRLDAFVRHFSNGFEDFEIFSSVNNRNSGDWKQDKDWTRVSRVFFCDIV